jgi:uncharacterized protein YqhQ
VAGIAYEIIKLAGRVKSPLLYPIILPGLLLQRLTTGEPDDQQLEVAISALKAALDRANRCRWKKGAPGPSNVYR